MEHLRRTWSEINLDNLEHNYRALRNIIGKDCKFMGVVKADAYGHGAVRISKALESFGADYLAVSSFDEARELRSGGVSAPVLILGHTPKEMVGELIKYDITQTVSCLAKALEYSAAAESIGKTLKIHIKLDTGMSRLGFLCKDEHFSGCIDSVYKACTLPGLMPEGIFTHFACSDSEDAHCKEYTKEQLSLFTKVVDALCERGISFKLRHCANSGAVANYPEAYFDMVRPGLLTYGYGEYAKKLGLLPVMSEKTVISTIKVFDEDTSISYGGSFVTDKKKRVGILPIGYADGFTRRLSNSYEVSTPYGKAKILGKICMDMCMIDLDKYPLCDVGDEIEIFGKCSKIEDMAALADTIPYEITCSVSKRVPRLYIKNGEVIDRVLNLNI